MGRTSRWKSTLVGAAASAGGTAGRRGAWGASARAASDARQSVATIPPAFHLHIRNTANLRASTRRTVYCTLVAGYQQPERAASARILDLDRVDHEDPLGEML